MLKRLAVAATIASGSLVVAPAHALITGIATGGTPASILGVDTFSVTGADMGAMSVTVFFTGGGSESAQWTPSGPGSGGAAGASGWSLRQSGDTFTLSNVWTLSVPGTAPIDRLLLNGNLGVLFDRTDPSPGTPDSASGRDITDAAAFGNGPFVAATYLDALGIGAANPVGDLWARLELQFAGATGAPGRFSGQWEFSQDTDLVAVPVPAALPLFAAGLAAFGWFARRRNAA